MYHLILNNRLLETTPEIKFFLLKYVRAFGVNSTIERTVKEIAKELGIANGIVTRSLRYLRDAGLLERQGVMGGGGRPSGRYAFSEKWRQLMDKGYQSTGTWQNDHKPLIDSLLVLDGEKGGHTLSVPNRIILMALIVNADACGVVRNLGKSDLMKITGMKRDRIEYQLTKLKSENYIRFSVAGITGIHLFGVSRGGYFLNLKHPSFKSLCRSSVMVLGPSVNWCDILMVGPAVSIHTEACHVIKNRNHEAARLEFDRDFDFAFNVENDFKKIAYFFKEYEIRQYLQFKLNDYAGYILSNYWNELSRAEEMSLKELREMIENDAISIKTKKSIHSDYEKENIKLLIDFLCEVTLFLARKYKLFISSIDGFKFDSADYVIIAHYRHSASRINVAIDCYARDSLGKYEYVKLSTTQADDGRYNIESKGLEIDLDVNVKYNYGLLTKLSEQPRV